METNDNKKEIEKEIKLLHQALAIDENVVLNEVIERLAEYNHPSSYKPVLDCFYQTENATKLYKDVFTSFFSKCHSNELLQMELNNILSRKNNIHHNVFLLANIWENNLNVFDQSEKLIQVAIDNSYSEAIEIYSIFDNTNEEISTEQLIKAEMLIISFTKENPLNEKTELLESIKERIHHLQDL